MIRRFPPLSLLIAFLLCAGGSALAADPGQLPETVNRIERETGARVLSAQRSQRGGREVNRIKVLTPEGRVRVMWDDPQRDRGAAGAGRSRQPVRDAARPSMVDREPVRDDG